MFLNLPPPAYRRLQTYRIRENGSHFVLANMCAVARPIPAPAAVMTTRNPSNSSFIGHHFKESSDNWPQPRLCVIVSQSRRRDEALGGSKCEERNVGCGTITYNPLFI